MAPRRLSGFDACFVYDERPEEAQHTLKVAFLSPEAGPAWSLERTRERISRRLAALPPLRWRMLRVPFDLHHPVCVDDPALDLAYHVRRAALPEPGGHRELVEWISELASHPLDPARPLWELWLVERYEGSRVVAVLKMSHALADGGETRALLDGLFSESFRVAESGAAAPAAEPSRLALLRDALRDRVRDLPRLAKLVRPALVAARRARALRRQPAGGSARITTLHAPWTPLCGPLDRRRAFDFASVSLDQAREVARAFDCTLNDVVLATAAGAVRQHLESRAALPDGPILAYMPASIREADERGQWGNRVSTRALALPTHLADPVAQLRAVRAGAAEAKADLALRRGANFEDFMRFAPPSAVKGVSRIMRALVRLRRDLQPGVVVSSVAGPREPLRVEGGSLENFVSVGHLKYAAGLNITTWSYAGRLNFALYACPRSIPDLARVAESVAVSFEALSKAAAREASRIRSPA
jgi:WS/DGAT/MGAT family acyltransferase